MMTVMMVMMTVRMVMMMMVYKRLSAIAMGMFKRETALMFSEEPRSHSARNRINIQRKRLY